MSTSLGRLFVAHERRGCSLEDENREDFSSTKMKYSTEQWAAKSQIFLCAFCSSKKRKKRTSLSVPLNIHSQWTVAMHYKYFNYVLLWRRRVEEEERRGRGFAAFYDFIASARKFISSLVPVPFCFNIQFLSLAAGLTFFALLLHHRRGVARASQTTCCDCIVYSVFCY